jgi:hypothetical protein
MYYHSEMNRDNIKKWSAANFLPYLAPESMIMDNARNHSVVLDKDPTPQTLKVEIISWLAAHNIEHDVAFTV